MDSSNEFGLQDKVVIITGAGRGIGRAAVTAFLSHGALVVLAGRERAAHAGLRDVVSTSRAIYVPTDVQDEEQVARLVETATSTFGRVDAAFNNAGTFGAFAPLHEDTLANFTDVVATNLRGAWLCTKHEIRSMLATGGGSIVNCASVAGHIGHGQSAIYSATKHAIIGLSKSAALQYARSGIRVNVVSPGSTDTEMLRSIYPTANERATRAARAPIGRLGAPEEIANAAVWLCSPLSSYVTGHTLLVDGGVVAGSAVARGNPPTSQ